MPKSPKKVGVRPLDDLDASSLADKQPHAGTLWPYKAHCINVITHHQYTIPQIVDVVGMGVSMTHLDYHMKA